jgi:hypothetical protein
LLGFYPGLERVRSFPVCCARAASGHAASAPPGVAKNFRRSMWLAIVTLRSGVIHAIGG